jgi:hypothetical protein
MPQEANQANQSEDQTLKELLADPRFQNLLAKAETHQREFRPNETERLEMEGRLMDVLIQRARECWDSLKSARKAGMHPWEAEEVALPLILLPDETEDNQE